MSLTLPHGPLSGQPADTNYTVEGPPHRLLFHDFPRRVRAELADQTVLDTRRGKLLHETGILPVLYAPEEDFVADLLEATDHSTHCPFKGDASYWSVSAGGKRSENAVWAYLEPLEQSSWLRGYRGVYHHKFDAWFDEDERILGHLRDPYHRVDVRRSSRRVRVLAGDEPIAVTARPKLLSETNVPNRFYIPLKDVRQELLEPSGTRAICPYKGEASYFSLRRDGELVEDVAWTYPDPLENALKVAGDLCFLHDSLAVEVDGELLQ
jgi:uncharacterized protein (DUF427 family)